MQSTLGERLLLPPRKIDRNQSTVHLLAGLFNKRLGSKYNLEIVRVEQTIHGGLKFSHLVLQILKTESLNT